MSTYSNGKIDSKSVGVILFRDNSNQQQWYDAVQAYCQKRSTIKFLYKRYNISKPLTVHDIQQAPERVKKEPPSPAKEQKVQDEEQQAPAPAAAARLAVYASLQQLDPLERRTLEGSRVYIDPEKTTQHAEVLETEERHTLRFDT